MVGELLEWIYLECGGAVLGEEKTVVLVWIPAELLTVAQ